MKQRGFGLLEVVLAAGILTLVVGAAIGLMRSSLRRADLSLQRTVAMNLAQEAIEAIRVQRDSTYIDRATNTWDATFSAFSSEDGTLAQAAPDSSFALNFEETGLVSSVPLEQGTENLTRGDVAFTREIYVTPFDESDTDAYLRLAGFSTSIRNQTTDAALIKRIHVIVRWGTLPTEAVEMVELLSDWRSGV